MDETGIIQAQAEQLRASGQLGRTRLLRLFDFLVEATLRGESPKGSVIAVAVFGRRVAVDGADDATVRVYIHNLRRRLDAWYAGPGHAATQRLVIPRGSYRLMLEPWAEARVPEGAEAASETERAAAAVQAEQAVEAGRVQAAGAQRWRLGGGLLALAALAVLVMALVLGLQPSRTPGQRAAASPVWAGMLANGHPILVVVGDYYLFGDTDRADQVQRLVRDFNINSRSELERYLSANPELATRYLDVGLGYLPTSTAFALNSILPVLAGQANPAVRIVLRSELDPEQLKRANLIYIGLLSGLGDLRSTVLAGSRFGIGESYDELVDRRTQKHYVSEVTPLEAEAGGLVGRPRYRDYGYFSSFAGLGGNRVLVIAGTRDEGLRQMAEVLGNPAALAELAAGAGAAASGRAGGDFEALYEVSGMDRVNLGGRLLLASPLDSAAIWGPH